MRRVTQTEDEVALDRRDIDLQTRNSGRGQLDEPFRRYTKHYFNRTLKMIPYQLSHRNLGCRGLLAHGEYRLVLPVQCQRVELPQDGDHINIHLPDKLGV